MVPQDGGKNAESICRTDQGSGTYAVDNFSRKDRTGHKSWNWGRTWNMRHLNLSFERTEVVGNSIAFHFKLKNDQGVHTRILGIQFELWQAAHSSGIENRLCDLRLDAQPTISESYTKLK